jgi:hypothetical protein
MKAIPSYQIGKALVEALGLPSNTIGFTLRCYAGELVSVECKYLPRDGGIVPALAQYSLVQREGKAQPTHDVDCIDFDAWMRERTDGAHQAYMERTSRRLPCDLTIEDIARYHGALV